MDVEFISDVARTRTLIAVPAEPGQTDVPFNSMRVASTNRARRQLCPQLKRGHHLIAGVFLAALHRCTASLLSTLQPRLPRFRCGVSC